MIETKQKSKYVDTFNVRLIIPIRVEFF